MRRARHRRSSCHARRGRRDANRAWPRPHGHHAAARFEDLPELPAVVYLSEVSHLVGDEAFCFGGGLYIDPVFPDYPMQSDCFARADRVADGACSRSKSPPPAAIDYYGMIDAAGAARPASATASFSVSVRRLSSHAPMSSASPGSRAAPRCRSHP